MAKRKRSGHRSHKIPLLASAGALAFAAQAYAGYKAGGLKEASAWVIGTDADGKFHPDWLLRNMTPVAVGALGSMIASKAHANRYLKVPFIKL